MVLRVKESTEIVAYVNPTFLLQKRLPGQQIPFSCPGDSWYSSDDSPSNSLLPWHRSTYWLLSRGLLTVQQLHIPYGLACYSRKPPKGLLMGPWVYLLLNHRCCHTLVIGRVSEQERNRNPHVVWILSWFRTSHHYVRSRPWQHSHTSGLGTPQSTCYLSKSLGPPKLPGWRNSQRRSAPIQPSAGYSPS